MGITAFPFTAVIDVPTARILGRDDAGTGSAEALTAAEVLALLGVYTTAQVDSLLSGKSNVGHTHTPADITGFGEAVDDEVATLLTAGTGISLSYNDNANTLTIASTVSAGISSLNGLTAATQTFAVGTTGTDVAFASAAGVHTLNIPDASATARGVVTTGTQSFAGVKSFTSQEIRLSSDGGTGLRIWRNVNNLQIDNSAAGWDGPVVISQNGSIGATVRGNAWGTTLQVTRGIDVGTQQGAVMLDCPTRGTLEICDNNSLTQATRIHVTNNRISSTSFERLEIGWASNICTIAVTAGSAGGTLRGLRIGGASTSLLAFYGATPVDRPDTVADPTGGGTIDAEARTAINTIIDRLQELGLIA